MSVSEDAEPQVDFALAAFRVEGRWEVQELTRHHLVDVETLADALRRLPGDAGALAIVAVDDYTFVLVRVLGPATRVLLSDASAADDFAFADAVMDFLGVDGRDDVDEDGTYTPPGDLGLLDDLGVSAAYLLEVVNDDDDEIGLDELLSDLADELGFGELFDDAVGLTPA